jgi:hypothetical protein
MVLTLLLGVVLGIIGGLWLADQAKPELKAGKIWFVLITLLFSLLVIAGSILFKTFPDYEAFLASSLMIATLAYVSYRKSF